MAMLSKMRSIKMDKLSFLVNDKFWLINRPTPPPFASGMENIAVVLNIWGRVNGV